MRGLVVLLCFTLAACSSSTEESSIIGPYIPPSMPTMIGVHEGIKKAAAEEKVTGPIEMSDVRQTDHGPGRFVLCIRGEQPASGPRRTYAVFFDNNDYKGSRMSVMIDDCEKQNYHALPY